MSQIAAVLVNAKTCHLSQECLFTKIPVIHSPNRSQRISKFLMVASTWNVGTFEYNLIKLGFLLHITEISYCHKFTNTFN